MHRLKVSAAVFLVLVGGWLSADRVSAQDARNIIQQLIDAAKQAKRKQEARPQPQTKAPEQTESPSEGEELEYKVGGYMLGQEVEPQKLKDEGYNCQPSEVYEGYSFCNASRTEKSPIKGPFAVKTSVLVSPSNNLHYINQVYDPAFWDAGEVEQDIDFRTKKFGSKPTLIKLANPAPALLFEATIAVWGSIKLEQLDAPSIRVLADGQSPKVGILIDYLSNLKKSALLRMPVYRIASGSGYIWISGVGAANKGTLRFLTIDMNSLKAATPSGPAVASVGNSPTAATGNPPAPNPQPGGQPQQSNEVISLARKEERTKVEAELQATIGSLKERLTMAEEALGNSTDVQSQRSKDASNAQTDVAMRQKQIDALEKALKEERTKSETEKQAAILSQQKELSKRHQEELLQRLNLEVLSATLAIIALLIGTVILWNRSRPAGVGLPQTDSTSSAIETRGAAAASKAVLGSELAQLQINAAAKNVLEQSTKPLLFWPAETVIEPASLLDKPNDQRVEMGTVTISAINAAEVGSIDTESYSRISKFLTTYREPSVILTSEVARFLNKLSVRPVAIAAFDMSLHPLRIDGRTKAFFSGDAFWISFLDQAQRVMSCRLCLSKVVAIVRGDDVVKTHLSKTVGRALLTGLGWGLIVKGSTLGASVLDLRYAGTEKKVISTITLMFNDMTLLELKGKRHLIDGFLKQMPPHLQSPECLESLLDEEDLLQRMAEDLPDILMEIDKEISDRIDNIDMKWKGLDQLATFSERDSMRQGVRSDCEQIERLIVRGRILCHESDRVGDRRLGSYRFFDQRLIDAFWS